MLEQETEKIVAIAHQRTIGSSQSIAIKDILAADIPVPVKTFFRADVEAMLLDELQQHRKTSRFNFRHPEVQNLQNQINSLLVLNFTFEQAEYDTRLNDTIHMLANYLVRPQWTLTNVLFEQEQSVSAQSLLRQMRYFGPYEYFRDILARYVSEKTVQSFTREQFSSLLWRIDAGYVRRKSGDELARILLPLYDFFDYPKHSENKTLIIKAIIKFFDDKGLSPVLPMLEGEIVQGKNEFSIRELAESLENVRRAGGAFEAVKTESAQQSATEVVKMESATTASPTMPEQTGETPQKKLQSKPVHILEFSDGEQKRYTRTLFRQDDTAFAEAMQALGQAPSWEEASKLIDEIFIRSIIDPYSSDALRFTETLFKQFHKNQ